MEATGQGFQPGQACYHIGPGVKPVPDAVDMSALLLGKLRKAKLRQQVTQCFVVQVIEIGPRNLAPTYTLLLRLIPASPKVCQLSPVGLDALRRSPVGQIADDAAAPVDHGAEGIKDNCLDGTQICFHKQSRQFRKPLRRWLRSLLRWKRFLQGLGCGARSRERWQSQCG